MRADIKGDKKQLIDLEWPNNGKTGGQKSCHLLHEGLSPSWR